MPYCPQLPRAGNHDTWHRNDKSQASAVCFGCRTLPELSSAMLFTPLQFANPPGHVQGAPEFATTKKRESYFQEFCSVTETFQENRVKAHRLSDEAAAFALQVSLRLVRVGLKFRFFLSWVLLFS